MEEKKFQKWGGLLETIEEAEGNHESERLNSIQKNIILLEEATMKCMIVERSPLSQGMTIRTI
jgi:hypothetical protein